VVPRFLFDLLLSIFGSRGRVSLPNQTGAETLLRPNFALLDYVWPRASWLRRTRRAPTTNAYAKQIVIARSREPVERRRSNLANTDVILSRRRRICLWNVVPQMRLHANQKADSSPFDGLRVTKFQVGAYCNTPLLQTHQNRNIKTGAETTPLQLPTIDAH